MSSELKDLGIIISIALEEFMPQENRDKANKCIGLALDNYIKILEDPKAYMNSIMEEVMKKIDK